ncbi:hypothetical protein FIBSPDRAFT_871359, partial [Athelia psychrophila]
MAAVAFPNDHPTRSCVEILREHYPHTHAQISLTHTAYSRQPTPRRNPAPRSSTSRRRWHPPGSSPPTS